MAGLDRNTQLVKLVFDFLHERLDAVFNRPKIVVFEFLAFGWLAAKQGAARRHQIGAQAYKRPRQSRNILAQRQPSA